MTAMQLDFDAIPTLRTVPARMTRDRAAAGRLWPGDRNALRRTYAAGHESLFDLLRLA
jgi:hypothetical protein